jgi:hypothetical protein
MKNTPKNSLKLNEKMIIEKSNSKETQPNEKYIIQIPNKRKHEIKAPKIKYFKPASTANSEVL